MFVPRVDPRAGPWLPLLLLASSAPAQTCLMLTPRSVAPGGAAVLDLWLYSRHGAAPSAIQWSLQYDFATVATLTVEDGPALSASGKSSICTPDAAGYQCVAAGANANEIINGVIARLTVVSAPAGPRTAILIENPTAASPEGYFVPIRVSADCRLYPRSTVPVGKGIHRGHEDR